MLVFKSSLQIYEKRNEKRNHDASVNEIYVCCGILLTTIMSYANNLAYAQNQTFTFHLKNVSIKTVLQTIENRVSLFLCIVQICWILLKKYQ